MCKKLVVGGLILVACLWVAKRTNFVSYAGTIIANGRDRLRQEIPRDLELARVRNEIKNLDRDYQALLGPIAERKVAVRRLEGEVSSAKANLTERREGLLALTSAVESKEKEIAYQGGNYNLAQAKVKLAQDFSLFRRMEVNLATQEKLLDAQRKNLSATLDQLGKLVNQKREFEITLAQLEAQEAVLAVDRCQSPLQTDEGRVADISNTLKEIQQAQEIEQAGRELQSQYGSKISDAQPPVPSVGDLSVIRDHLEGRVTTPATKVAQGK